jgi:hypothetical protein
VGLDIPAPRIAGDEGDFRLVNQVFNAVMSALTRATMIRTLNYRR